MNEQIELAWCAGFIEGEGSVSRDSRRLTVAQSSQAVEMPRELERLRTALGGKVAGPLPTFTNVSKYYGPQKPHYEWSIGGVAAVEVVRALLPYLIGPKAEKMKAWL